MAAVSPLFALFSLADRMDVIDIQPLLDHLRRLDRSPRTDEETEAPLGLLVAAAG